MQSDAACRCPAGATLALLTQAGGDSISRCLVESRKKNSYSLFYARRADCKMQDSIENHAHYRIASSESRAGVMDWVTQIGEFKSRSWLNFTFAPPIVRLILDT